MVEVPLCGRRREAAGIVWAAWGHHLALAKAWGVHPKSGQADVTTRLIVRERIGFGRRITELAMAPVGLVSFVMTRPMMRGVKARAEGATGTGSHPPRAWVRALPRARRRPGSPRR